MQVAGKPSFVWAEPKSILQITSKTKTLFIKKIKTEPFEVNLALGTTIGVQLMVILAEFPYASRVKQIVGLHINRIRLFHSLTKNTKLV